MPQIRKKKKKAWDIEPRKFLPWHMEASNWFYCWNAPIVFRREVVPPMRIISLSQVEWFQAKSSCWRGLFIVCHAEFVHPKTRVLMSNGTNLPEVHKIGYLKYLRRMNNKESTKPIKKIAKHWDETNSDFCASNMASHQLPFANS